MTSYRLPIALALLLSSAALVAFYVPAKRFVADLGMPPGAVLAVIGAAIAVAAVLLRRRR